MVAVHADSRGWHGSNFGIDVFSLKAHQRRWTGTKRSTIKWGQNEKAYDFGGRRNDGSFSAGAGPVGREQERL